MLLAFKVVDICRQRYPTCLFKIFQDPIKEADDIIHQLIRRIRRAIVVSEDGDFLINCRLYKLLSTRFSRFTYNTELKSAGEYALEVAYCMSYYISLKISKMVLYFNIVDVKGSYSS